MRNATVNVVENMNIKNINPVVNITVSQENCGQIEEIFNYFTKECGINSLKACIVRDEGVYSRPKDKIDKIASVHNYLDTLPEIGKVLSFSSIIDVATLLNNNKPFGDYGFPKFLTHK